MHLIWRLSWGKSRIKQWSNQNWICLFTFNFQLKFSTGELAHRKMKIGDFVFSTPSIHVQESEVKTGECRRCFCFVKMMRKSNFDQRFTIHNFSAALMNSINLFIWICFWFQLLQREHILSHFFKKQKNEIKINNKIKNNKQAF